MAVVSDGSYYVDEGLVSSFPITCENGAWSIVEGVELTDFSKEKIEATVDELRGERDSVKELQLV
jgi:malate dehydrogenase